MIEKVVITQKDWKNYKYQAFRNDQLTLAILKDKGAPVKGNMFFKADTENYVWERFKDDSNGNDIFLIKIKNRR